ncbi:hypothetical protein EP837_03683 (plasmid) [Sphingobium sp. EP60837]|nr:hypothetical protein EP837_03683 [Sphingobium sp. EP60837]
MGKKEGRDRLAFDACPLRHIGNHLVLECKAQHLAAFRLGNPRDGGEHGRLARTRDALDDDRAVGRGNNQAGGRQLPGVELMNAHRLKPSWGVCSSDNWRRPALSSFYQIKNLLLGR